MSRLLLALAALTLVTACGIKGDLDRPDPLWNSEDAIRRECQRQLDNNEQQDPRCAQYQTGAQPSRYIAPPIDEPHMTPVAVEVAPEAAPRAVIPEAIEGRASKTP